MQKCIKEHRFKIYYCIINCASIEENTIRFLFACFCAFFLFVPCTNPRALMWAGIPKLDHGNLQQCASDLPHSHTGCGRCW